jgi:hypothetical protein
MCLKRGKKKPSICGNRPKTKFGCTEDSGNGGSAEPSGGGNGRVTPSDPNTGDDGDEG